MAKAGSVEIPVELDTKGFEAQIKYTEDKLDTMIKEYKALGKEKKPDTEAMIKLGSEIEKAKNKVVDLKAKQDELTYGKSTAELDQHEFKIGKIIKKVGKWAGAIFGLRSIYSFIRSSMSTITQYDEKMASNIEYIRYALAYAVKPIVEWIVNAVMTIMQYVNYIANAWFGKNLFANSGVKQFQSSMGKAEKSAKNIEKSLMSFDEINKLEDTSSASAGGVGGSSVAPSFDLSQIPTEVPKWVQWIADHKDEIIEVAKIIAGAIVLAKGIQWVSNISSVASSIGKIGSDMGGINWKAVLIGISIAAIARSAYEWYKAQKETAKLVDDINKNGLTNNKKWLEQTSDLNDINQEINNKRAQGNDLMREMNKLTSNVTGASKLHGETLRNNINIQDQMIQKEWQMYQNGEMSEEQKKEFIKLLHEQVGYLDDSYEYLKLNFQETGNIEELSDSYEAILREIDKDHKNIFEKLGFIESETESQSQKTSGWWRNLNSVKDKMIEIANTKLGNKELIVDIRAKLDNFKASLNNIFGKIGASFGIDFTKFKLASGGIINNPGRGVQLGTSIIGGEAGPEAVLPLTDETFEKLGQAIARNMTINATMVNQMNGRVISRELQRITTENDFSYNR